MLREYILFVSRLFLLNSGTKVNRNEKYYNT